MRAALEQDLVPAFRRIAATGLAESLALPLLLPLIGWAVHAHDPYFLGHLFPWFLLPSLLAALRHGFVAGCASATAVAAPMIVLWRLQWMGNAPFPAEALLGMFVSTMIAGQTADVWFREKQRLTETLELAGRRANEFARAHFLTQLSHEKLQEEHPTLPNLHEAVARLVQSPGEREPTWASMGNLLMSTLAQYCGLETATLISYVAATGIVPEAKLAHPVPVPLNDDLLGVAARTGQIACIDRQAAAGKEQILSALLAVVPAIDSAGRVRAYLCIQSMPFFSFNRSNLENVGILLGHCADRLGSSGRSFDPDQEHQDLFDQRLAQALAERQQGLLPSVVGVLELRPGSTLRALVDRLLPAILGPQDRICRRRLARGSAALWLLMPGAGEGNVRTVVARLDQLTRHELGRSLTEAGGAAAFRVVGPEDTMPTIFAALEEALEARRGDA